MRLHLKNIHAILLIGILVCGFSIRLYKFNNPIADWHSWRQADTSAVSRNFITHGLDLLHPTYDDISNIQSGKDNPRGYRFVEFPIYNIFQAMFFKLFGILTLEQWGRLVSIISSLFSVYFIYALTTKYSRKEIGLFAAFFYSFLPFNIYYNRAILPDSTMVTAILAGTYFFDLWIEKNIKLKTENLQQTLPLFLLAVVFTSSAFLLKPFALFFTLPIVYITYKHFGLHFLKKWELWIFALLSLAPFVLWRLWISQYPEGIPANTWLLNGNGIRFRPAFFRWIIYERIAKLIHGYAGIIFPLLGLYQLKQTKNQGFFVSFALASILYTIVFATGNVQHDYYQILIMPTIAIFCALGTFFLYSFGNKLIGWGSLLIVIIVMFFLSYLQVKDYFNINNYAIVEAGLKADKILPKEALVIAPYNGDTSLLYHINRKGWPAFQKSTEELIEMGASFIVLVNPTAQDRKDYSEKFSIIESEKNFIIVRLKR